MSKTTVRGRWSVMLGCLAVLIIAQAAQQLLIMELGFQDAVNWLGPLIGFPPGLFLWTLIVYRIAKSANPTAPSYSRYLELYLLAALAQVVAVALHWVNYAWLGDAGLELFNPPFRIYLLGKLAQLMIFFGLAIHVTRTESLGPAPLISPSTGGVV